MKVCKSIIEICHYKNELVQRRLKFKALHLGHNGLIVLSEHCAYLSIPILLSVILSNTAISSVQY